MFKHIICNNTMFNNFIIVIVIVMVIVIVVIVIVATTQPSHITRTQDFPRDSKTKKMLQESRRYHVYDCVLARIVARFSRSLLLGPESLLGISGIPHAILLKGCGVTSSPGCPSSRA